MTGIARKGGVLLTCILLGFPVLALGNAWPLFQVNSLNKAPFPSNRFTTPDSRQLTRLRVDLPHPDCGVYPSDCEDIDVLNELDGFNIQPRISIPFSRPLLLGSISHTSVLLVEVLPRTGRVVGIEVLPRMGRVVGINEMVWDPATNTLFAESDQVLRQHSTYLLLVTDRLRDTAGRRIRRAPEFERMLALPMARLSRYERMLRMALSALPRAMGNRTMAASLFTTQSTTAVMEKIRRQVYALPTPAPADFRLAGAGEAPTVFPTEPTLPSIRIYRQTTTAPEPDFETQLCLVSVQPPPAYTGTIAFGQYLSPVFVGAGNRIPTVPTRLGTPAVLGEEEIVFILFLPRGSPPPGGWPVAIFGHGFESTKGLACILHDELNAAGIAVIAISAAGHDRGPLSNVVVDSGSGTVSFPWGGRGIDLNGDGQIGRAEGVGAAPPRTLTGLRDGMQQTVADLIQLTRVIGVGMDVDGDGSPDLNPGRIYYFGHSNGGRYGSMLTAVEPAVRAAVFVAPSGGSRAYLAQSHRPLFIAQLGARTPNLLNIPSPPATPTDYDADLPLRNEPVRVATVPGSLALQQLFEREEWARMPGDTVGYAFNLRPAPKGCLPSVPCRDKHVLVQMAKGDQTIPNPDTSSWIRTGQLAGVTTYLRWDLFWPDFCPLPAPTFPMGDPHSFILSGDRELVRSHKQIATFFATDGAKIENLGIPGPYWETPIVGPLPETLNFVGACPRP